MKDVIVQLATQEDDSDIRRLLARNPIPGQLEVSYEREPDYFLGCGPMGHFYQVVIARHEPDGDLVGLACRSIRPLYINGERQDVGYLSQLRIDSRYRGRWLVPLGYRFMEELHADGRTSGYITTIIEGNVTAIGLLVNRARGSIPKYRQVSRLHTLAYFLRPRRIPSTFPLEISRGSLSDLNEIVEFLNHHGAAKQFFPVYTAADFIENPITEGFDLGDLFLVRRNGELVGTMGLWDQSDYKQSVVHAYQGALRWLRPIYNWGLRIARTKSLPPPGNPISYAYASFLCVKDNDTDTFDLLIRAVLNEAYTQGHAYLMLGLSEQDPLLTSARRYWHMRYDSRLYTVCWPKDAGWHDQLDSRVPFVELATL